MSTIWEDLGKLIDSLPPEEREQAHTKLQTWVHDLRGKLSVVYSAVGLLERSGSPDQHDTMRLMKDNSRQIIEILEEIRQVYRDND